MLGFTITDSENLILKEHAGFTYLLAFALFSQSLVFFLFSDLMGYVSLSFPILYLIYSRKLILLVDKKKKEIRLIRKSILLKDASVYNLSEVGKISVEKRLGIGGSKGIYWPVSQITIFLVLSDLTKIKIYPNSIVQNSMSNELVAAKALADFLGVPMGYSEEEVVRKKPGKPTIILLLFLLLLSLFLSLYLRRYQ